jgi:hypothetical protein
MEYKDEELTGWFDLEAQKPWETGVYRVKTSCGQTGFSYWTGEFFCAGSNTASHATDWASIEFVKTSFTIAEWRGLNHNPCAPVKPKSKGNKRKTMYVVCHQASRSTEAAFNKKENAQEYAEYLNFPVYIKKIRFRTPEHN